MNKTRITELSLFEQSIFSLSMNHRCMRMKDRQTDYVASIQIFGRPAYDGLRAKSTLICFYPDGDPNICKPSYDEIRQQIRICYTMSLFETQVENLTQHYEVECTYHHSSTPSQSDAFSPGIRVVPDQLH